MKNYGKVMEYNGVYGIIKGIDGIDYKSITTLPNDPQDPPK